jgi:hypothetical protein
MRVQIPLFLTMTPYFQEVIGSHRIFAASIYFDVKNSVRNAA